MINSHAASVIGHAIGPVGRRLVMVLASLLAGVAATPSWAAMVVVPATYITFVENGWYGEGLALHVAPGGVSGCTAPPNEFAIPKEHPSYKELVAMAISAQLTNVKVELIVNTGECLFGNRTRVISIRLVK